MNRYELMNKEDTYNEPKSGDTKTYTKVEKNLLGRRRTGEHSISRRL